jgi:hypothetical protein
MKIPEDSNKDDLKNVIYYKNIMQAVFLFGVISFFSLGIFGYFNNCIFLLWNTRVLGVQQFITFVAVISASLFFTLRKEKYENNKMKFNVEKKLVIVLMEIGVCLILTLISAFMVNN